ncbi:MAG: recombinase family protein [Selenomonadaceae bacterium]|nr:recombinase family protein [Selenomonadaceae bacterium]
MSKLYGYARVSTAEQNTDRQIISLTKFGVSRENIFAEKQSGKDFKRPKYNKLISKLRPKDAIVLSSLDRLGRNYNEIIEQWRIITNEKKADIIILDMKLLDTRSEYDLIESLISAVVLKILSYVAEKERENIITRQKEGIDVAKARGVKFGRPKIERPKNFITVYRKWKNKEITVCVNIFSVIFPYIP